MKGVAVAFVVLLAGCSAHAPVPPGIPTDAHGDALPTVHGVVVDEAIHPLAGATVRFLGTDVNTTTGPDGRYEIHRPTMKAQAVLITASKPGFKTLTQQTQVSGYRSVKMNFGLQVDRYTVPHVDLVKYRGVVRCTLAVIVAGQAQGLQCAPDRANENGDVGGWMWAVTPDPGLAGLIQEVHWEAQTEYAKNLHAWVVAPVAGGHGGELQASATGPDPLRLEIPAEKARALDRWTAAWGHVELADSGAPVSASHEQSFEVLAALFYVDPAPPGFTFDGS